LDKQAEYRQISIIAGGTGITPFLQILNDAENVNDGTEFTIIYANKSESDILAKE
jgi:ferredoxin-NADP reductase